MKSLAAAVALVAVVLLSGCSSGPGEVGTPTDPVAAARQLEGAPSWVTTPSGDDCGTVDIGQDLTLPSAALDCLRNAVAADRSATVAWVLRTTEGDPIPTFARADGAGVDVVSNATYDAYGSGGWSRSHCATVDDLPYGRGCD